MFNNVIKVRLEEAYNNVSSSQSIDWKIGSWWGYNDKFINENDSLNLRKVLKHIYNHKVKLSKKETIYASKASEIPRFKLKEFIAENKFKKTSRFNYASVIIINRGYLNQLEKMLTISEHTFMNETLMKRVYNSWEKDRHTRVGSDMKNKVLNLIKNTNDWNLAGLVDKSYNFSKLLVKNSTIQNEYIQNTHKVKGIYLSLYRDARMENLISLLADQANRILSGQTQIVFDEDMFVDMNKDGIALDDEYLQTLRDMLFSKDESNVKLGFEMMSNLVIDQPTLLSISFLLNELSNTTRFRPSYYTASNSNLKSLLKLLETKGISWDKDWKTFGTGLRMNFKDGKEGEIVKKFLLDNINREFKLKNSQAEALVDIVFTTEAEVVNS